MIKKIIILNIFILIVVIIICFNYNSSYFEFKYYRNSFEILNDSIIDNYKSINTKERKTYFINFSENTVYRHTNYQEDIIFSDENTIKSIQKFSSYPFECIYASSKQIEYVYSEGFISFIYVVEGIYPKYEKTFDTTAKWLGGKWYIVKIGN